LSNPAAGGGAASEAMLEGGGPPSFPRADAWCSWAGRNDRTGEKEKETNSEENQGKLPGKGVEKNDNGASLVDLGGTRSEGLRIE